MALDPPLALEPSLPAVPPLSASPQPAPKSHPQRTSALETQNIALETRNIGTGTSLKRNRLDLVYRPSRANLNVLVH
jgi:hypothetical protein